MKIGIAGPVALPMLSSYVENGDQLPPGYSFPPIAVLAEEMMRRGHHVSVFALDPSTTEPRVFRGDRITIHVGAYRPTRRGRDLFAIERAHLLTAMQSDPCDIIHAHWTYEFALAALASGQPHLITAHDAPWQVLRHYFNRYRAVRLFMAYQVAQRARHMTAVSPYVMEHFQKKMFYRGNITVVPNAIPDWLFRIGNRESHSLSPVVTFATVLNGWGQLKNGRVALQAFQRIRSLLPGARLMMFGAGHSPDDEAAVWADAQGLTAGVEFVGPVKYTELLARLSGEVDVLVHPALEESFCMAIAEAMALGIPVIGGRNSGAVASTMADGEAGPLVDVRSVKEVADAMLRLGQDGASRSRYGHDGRRSALDRFHMDKVLSSLEDIYDRVQCTP